MASDTESDKLTVVVAVISAPLLINIDGLRGGVASKTIKPLPPPPPVELGAGGGIGGGEGGEGGGGGNGALTTNSNAPISKPASWGALVPKKSMSVMVSGAPASIAGLIDCNE